MVGTKKIVGGSLKIYRSALVGASSAEGNKVTCRNTNNDDAL
jgi:hypothetical protein